MILGTAGHIDHGKTALVKALTGVDTDRLPEERQRGITIELGFAPLPLPGVGVMGVVDVPGHEGFVRTMLAGASGIDLALLVVAADEGVMPQTREHLAILDLLGIRSGVIALTKADLVEEEWLMLVREEVAAAVAGSSLAGAPLIPVSVVTGVGVEVLRSAIATAALAVPQRDETDLFRLPVDRTFSVRGTGTVVTGTVWTGQLHRDEVVRVLPGGHTARVRGLQSHGVSVDVAEPGSRLAINLGGVDVADIPRGSTVVTFPAWEPVDVIRADITMLPSAPVIGPRASLRFHLGTRDVGARVVSSTIEAPSPGADPYYLGGEVGGPRPVRIVLEEPVVVRGGDRFVLRVGSPAATIGGGVVTDGAPGHRRVRPWALPNLSLVDRVAAMVADAGARGVPCGVLAVRAGLRPASIADLVSGVGDRAEIIGGALYDRTVIAEVKQRLLQAVAAHHDRAPLEEGMSLQSLRNDAQAPATLTDELLRQLVVDGAIVIEGASVRRAGWVVRPSRSQLAALEALTRLVADAGREPPSTSELALSTVIQKTEEIATLLRLLERRGVVRQVESERYYAVAVLSEMARALQAGMAGGRECSPAELRDLLGVSRKYLIPLLEYFDRIGVTERRATGRVLGARSVLNDGREGATGAALMG